MEKASTKQILQIKATLDKNKSQRMQVVYSFMVDDWDEGEPATGIMFSKLNKLSQIFKPGTDI